MKKKKKTWEHHEELFANKFKTKQNLEIPRKISLPKLS